MAKEPQPPARETDPTVASGPRAPAATGHDRFLPGAMVAGRYRIVALLGQGGMGEVYRAEDLKLGQTVALKFLPMGVERDTALLQRLFGEVKLARQVSHPNICRVHDIVEADGRHFISMEFVDGEDLSSLLRRIGYLPTQRAIQVARELCAGLAAAHDQKVLHRDLKPANIMLDGRGHARITDFGLAIGAGEASGGEVLSGTPAYMAPEQRAGVEVTARSDVYALGLVLHELFTGKPAFTARSLEELAYLQSQGPPSRPSEIIADLDPAVERTILSCLASDPTERPASASRVAALLPGADSRAVLVTPGETPSPEMVAASGGKGGLMPRTAWMLFAASISALAVVQVLSPYCTDLGLARWTKPVPVLVERAHEIIAGFGYDKNPVDSDARVVNQHAGLLPYLAQRKPWGEWREQVARWGPRVALIYRQSPLPMVPGRFGWSVTAEDPPLSVSGMVSLSLDATGRLRSFTAVPPRRDTTAAAATSFDWTPLFVAAGLDPGRFTEVEPSWVPPVAFDRRVEWTGTADWDSDIPLRIAAAAWRDKPVSFQIHGPWSRPERLAAAPKAAWETITRVLLIIILLSALGGLALFARRNMMKGRGDRRGATRLGLVGAAFMMLGAVGVHMPPDFIALTWIMLQCLIFAIAFGVATAVIYLAVEPFVRRRMPELMIGWARLLDGRAGDPRVGRDLLVGGVLGACATAIRFGLSTLPAVLALPGQETLPTREYGLRGGVMLISYLAELIGADIISSSIFTLGLYLAVLLVVRRRAVAIPLFGLIMGAPAIYPGVPGILNGLLLGAIVAFITVRFGLLTLAGFFAVYLIQESMPLPIDPGAAYGPTSLILLLVLLAYFAWALRVSVGSRPLFRLALEE